VALEGSVLILLREGWDSEDICQWLRPDMNTFADLTISLVKQIYQVIGPFIKKECRLSFRKQYLVLLRPENSGLVSTVTKDDLVTTISEIFIQCHAKHISEGKHEAKYRSINADNAFFDWDWSELVIICESLKSFRPNEVQDPQQACQSRIFLSQLRPQTQKWEWVTIV
jgi:hypothetical protein